MRSSRKMPSSSSSSSGIDRIKELSPQEPYPKIRRRLNDLPEEESLRHIIRTRFPNGMTEDFIAIILRDILEALQHLHVKWMYGYENTNSGDIFVSTDQEDILIGLAYNETRPFVHPAGQWEKGKSETDGTWGLGIIALELAYGSLPRNCTGREQLVAMSKNLVRILKLQLKYEDDEVEDIDEVKTEAEKAENEGKEKEAVKKSIKLPELERLLDDGYVESLVKQLQQENNDQGTKNAPAVSKKESKEAKNISRKTDDGMGKKAKNISGKADDGMGIEFSRGFLQVVMELLDKTDWCSTDMILSHPFLQELEPIERARFDLGIRGAGGRLGQRQIIR